MIKHSQHTQSNKFGISSQNLKRKLILHPNKHQSFCNLALSALMVSAKQNFTCVMKSFNVAAAFVFYWDGKHSDILWGSSDVCCYLFQIRSLPVDVYKIVAYPKSI